MLTGGYNVGMAKERPKARGRPSHSPEEALFKKQVGNNLKTVRRALNLNVAVFAEALGVPTSSYEKYELGIAFPKPQVWKRLTEIGVSTDFLFTGIGKPFIRPVDMSAVLIGRAQNH